MDLGPMDPLPEREYFMFLNKQRVRTMKTVLLMLDFATFSSGFSPLGNGHGVFGFLPNA